MRWLPAVLLAAGLILGVVLPIAGFGRLPFLLGVLCLAAAGIATRRAIFALAGIAAAVLLFFVPGFVTARRNDQGIAWTAPKGERVVLAEAGLAVTEEAQGRRITARDLDTGKRRWGFKLADQTSFSGDVEVRRVGRTLLVSDRAGGLRALDMDSGKSRWDIPGVDGLTLPAIATPELVAITRCGEDCTAEVRSLEDGSVRWRARVAQDTWLGSPPIAQSLDIDRSLWPASAVILRTPPEGERYEVRELATGKVVAGGTARDDAVGRRQPLHPRAA